MKKNNIILLALLLGSHSLCSLVNAATPIPLDTTYNLNGALKNIQRKNPTVRLASTDLPAGIKAEKNLVYATLPSTPFGARDLHLDIFRPQKRGKYPALIQVHGGGWRSGNKLMETAMAQQIALAGYVTIPVEYRLSLEAQYPAAVHDIKAAIRWIKTNAEKYDIDTTKIAITGNSAGGQLATLVGMTNKVTKFEGNEGTVTASSTVHAVIDIDGVVDFMAPGSLNLDRKPDSPDVAWLGGTFYQKPEIWKDASPIFWVNAKSVPVLFINSTQHRFHAGEDEMIGLLNQNGIYNEAYTIDNTPHTFWLFHPWFDDTVKYAVNFLNKVFKQ